jgi:hypothetical protein
MLPRWHDSNRGMCHLSFLEYLCLLHYRFPLLWKHIPPSLSCQRGNIAVIFTIDNAKIVAP